MGLCWCLATVWSGSRQTGREVLSIFMAEHLYHMATGVKARWDATSGHYPLSSHIEVRQAGQGPFDAGHNGFWCWHPSFIGTVVVTGVAPRGVGCGYIGYLHQRGDAGIMCFQAL